MFHFHPATSEGQTHRTFPDNFEFVVGLKLRSYKIKERAACFRTTNRTLCQTHTKHSIRALVCPCLAGFHIWPLLFCLVFYRVCLCGCGWYSHIACTEVAIMDLTFWRVIGLFAVTLNTNFTQGRNHGYVAGGIACKLQQRILTVITQLHISSLFNHCGLDTQLPTN